MAVFPVVLDANVLIPSSLRDTLLRSAEAGLYRVHWSQQILDEVVRNLLKERANKEPMMTEQQAHYLISQMSMAFPEAMVEVPPDLISIMTNDVKDRHVLAAAVIAKAQVIVTDNIRDFQSGHTKHWDIEAQTADVFLTHLYYLAPEIMVDIIHQQAIERKKPITVLKLFESLKKQVPIFVSKIESH